MSEMEKTYDEEGLFIEISEDDVFEEVVLSARTEDGVDVEAGSMSKGPGRYELRKVVDDDE